MHLMIITYVVQGVARGQSSFYAKVIQEWGLSALSSLFSQSRCHSC